MSIMRLDIGGPKGNAFYILGLVKELSGDDKETTEKIQSEMKSGNYNHLLRTFSEAFPGVELYSHSVLSSVDEDLYTVNYDIEL